ncbi:ATP synthase subunit d, mitochondrial-like [Platysternon megacephalum]|uniref:ATP synthase subunit d, mitochondrial-like n=1 Tax=Platysternon megacephalum TaxID=55544 RepID=A0A4D9EDK8_9SAUR|nr:ATP synthase subunit d, mitochondrial-like [Platysternon megacephalum]
MAAAAVAELVRQRDSPPAALAGFVLNQTSQLDTNKTDKGTVSDGMRLTDKLVKTLL